MSRYPGRALGGLIALTLAVGMAVVGVPRAVSAVPAAPEAPGAKAMILIEASTGQVLAERDADQQMPIASVTKVMGLLLSMEALEKGNITLEETLACSPNAAGMGGSQALLEAGGEYQIGDLLKSMVIASANDSCVAMAERLAGSEDAFVELMNQRAQELGMTNTVFKNCTGLPVEGAHSTARDVALMSRALMQYEDIYTKWSTIWLDEMIHPGGRVTSLTNTNKMIRSYDGADGVKTGSTSEAGFCVSATAKRGGMRLIAVVLGESDSKVRFAEAGEVLDWGFANYSVTQAVKKGDVLVENLPVLRGVQTQINAVAAEDVSLLHEKGTPEVEIQTDCPGQITAPVAEGQQIGSARVLLNGEQVGSCLLVAAGPIEEAGIGHYLRRILTGWGRAA
ncbi:MAG: D-alanyl-D-alanine carboxypeptidase family protein [Christensenellales bacterium]|jgi:D-alanyl-D-alanine carboxypeptidase (penicillin-binding protein 5/6)